MIAEIDEFKDEDVDLPEDVSSSHSSERRNLDVEIQLRTAVFRKSAFQKSEVKLNPTRAKASKSELGSRDGSFNGGGRVR